jgi:6-phosphogluconolactonase/glucosamine-6-phosphate isomerase/deaminase
MMLLTVVPDPEQLARPAAEWLEAEILASIRARGRCALALAGGRTPEPVYRELAQAADVDWSRVSVFFGDERPDLGVGEARPRPSRLARGVAKRHIAGAQVEVRGLRA